LQKKQIIHGDLKLGNILLNKKGKIKLVDFGLAKLLKNGKEFIKLKKKIFGTPNYIAPETLII